MTSTDANDTTSEHGRLLADEEDGTLSLRIDNPKRANALDGPVLDALIEALRAPAESIRVALLGASGDRHFSSGLDLGDHDARGLVDYLPTAEEHLGRAAAALRECPVPVVGVINGAAFGGALELAMACDWRIAAERARFGMPAAKIGVVYTAQGLQRFVAALGAPRAKELFLTGTPITADRARDIGLVDRVVRDRDLWEVARKEAQAVAASAPLAVAGTRRVIDALAHGLPGEDATRLADEARRVAFASEDFREGLAAFRGKRPPHFRAR
ncbi:MAG: enoyl-CoA hydratase-related protein [Thermoleophilia bacterium]|nr:enoyl-CoA hydratase-related protein [Thermoleophilia bacterium]